MKPAKPKAPAKADAMAMSMRDREREWKVRDGLDTLQRAEEIKRDPKLMREIEDCRQKKMADLANIKVTVAPNTMKMKRD